jgi:hypothetical protein
VFLFRETTELMLALYLYGDCNQICFTKSVFYEMFITFHVVLHPLVVDREDLWNK